MPSKVSMVPSTEESYREAGKRGEVGGSEVAVGYKNAGPCKD